MVTIIFTIVWFFWLKFEFAIYLLISENKYVLNSLSVGIKCLLGFYLPSQYIYNWVEKDITVFLLVFFPMESRLCIFIVYVNYIYIYLSILFVSIFISFLSHYFLHYWQLLLPLITYFLLNFDLPLRESIFIIKLSSPL